MEKDKVKYLVGVVSLGCDKNRVDTENMMTFLKESGEFEFTSDSKEADIIIINTCAFIQSARNEAKDTIEEMLELKKKGNCKCLVVSGCYPQKYLPELKREYKDVDIFLGVNEYNRIAQILSSFMRSSSKDQIIETKSPYCINEVTKGRLISTPSHYAYLKIADGCDNFCSYCTIPYIRGRYRSRTIESLVQEAQDLVSHGVEEIILVAQDIGRFGIDIYGEVRLVELIQKLSKIKKLKWIRLLYVYPETVTDELIEEMANNQKVCHYIDIPFQHISNNILSRMNRRVDSKQINVIVDKLVSRIPDIAIRSTFIVGFPGEGTAEFEELLEFLKNKKLPNVGFFVYSREDGTVAARLDSQVDEFTKERRLLKAVKLQKKIVNEFNKTQIGKIQTVVVEGFDEKMGLYIGRSQYQAPEIDTVTYFSNSKEEGLKIGQRVNVFIAKTKGYDLIGITEEGEN